MKLFKGDQSKAILNPFIDKALCNFMLSTLLRLSDFFPKEAWGWGWGGAERSRQKLKEKNNTDVVALTFILLKYFFDKLDFLSLLLSIFPRNTFFFVFCLFVLRSQI